MLKPGELAAYHGIAERGVVSRRFSELGSKMIAAAMIPFALAMSRGLMLITHIVISSKAAATVTFIGALAAFLTASFVFRLGARRAHPHHPWRT